MRRYFLLLILVVPILLVFAANSENNSNLNSDLIIAKNAKTKSVETVKIVPSLTIKGKKGEADFNLGIKSLAISVDILANQAITTLDIVYKNNLDRILEGSLEFPLSEKQQISRFALEVDGKLREGVIIEKEKGQEVFESVIRTNIDPGLLEHVEGNSYRARIYPIPAKGTKRMVIAFENDLELLSDGNLNYDLPLGFKDKLEKFKITIKVHSENVKPIIVKNSLTTIDFKKSEDYFIADLEKTNFYANQSISIQIPTKNNSISHFTSLENNEYYFYTSILPKTEIRPKIFKENITLLWDVSLSMVGRDLKKEIQLIESLINSINTKSIRLITFSTEIHNDEKFIIQNGNWNILREYLENLTYDGATDFSILSKIDLQDSECFLFSDGLTNLSSKNEISNKNIIHVISSNQQSEFKYARNIADASGGHFVNLTNQSVLNAYESLLKEPFRFIKADYNSENISETFPSISTPVNGIFNFSGKFNGAYAKLTLHFGYGQEITESVNLTLTNNHNVSNRSLEKMWARSKLEEMEKLQLDEKVLQQHAKKYSIVSPYTSLIVLDRLEDYVTHQIVPPVELQKEYFEIVENNKLLNSKSEKENLDRIVNMYQKKIDWWKTDFQAIKKEKATKKNDESGMIINDSAVHLEINYNITNTYSFSAPIANGCATTSLDVSDLNIEDPVFDIETSNIKRKNQIKLSNWDPNAPYMKEIKKSSKKDLYQTYLKLRSQYQRSPSFYLDVSDYFFAQEEYQKGIRILSNLIEMEVKSYKLMRVLAHRFEELKEYEKAIFIYREVLKLRPEEPQSYRDLGLALAANGNEQEAIEILYSVVLKNWDLRFPEIESLIMGEINSIIANSKNNLNIDFIDPRLLKALPVDIRIVLTWDSDNCDMDLWLTDPDGDKCFYSNKETSNGMTISRDFTSGYGPEEIMLKKAIKGKYKVQVDYFGTREQTITGATTIQIKLYTNYGKNNQKVKEITRRLETKKEVLEVAEFIF